MEVTVYTDGSALGNPGPGGYGIVMLSNKGHYKELSGGFRKTTNNRMELLAVIKSLEAVKDPNTPVKIYSDSKYVVDAITLGWVYGWAKKGFAKKKNPDLWKKYLLFAHGRDLQFEWVKGHAGNKYNEVCDKLAVKAANQKNLPPDTFYENLGKGLFE